VVGLSFLLLLAPAEAQEDPFGGNPFGQETTEAPQEDGDEPGALDNPFQQGGQTPFETEDATEETDSPQAQPPTALGREATLEEQVAESLANQEETLDDMRPAVAAVMATQPNAPIDLVDAAVTLARLERPDLSKQLLTQFLEQEIADEQLADIAQSVGPLQLLLLSGRTDLVPEGRRAAQRILDGSNRYWARQSQTDAALEKLHSGELRDMVQGARDLRRAGDAGAKRLVESLGVAESEKSVAEVKTLMKTMKTAVRPMLIAALESENPRLVVQAADVLASFGESRDMYYLLGPLFLLPNDHRRELADLFQKHYKAVPDAEEAKTLLLQEALYYYHRERVLPTTPGEAVSLWHWDTQKDELVQQSFSKGSVYRIRTLRFARDAFRLSPEEWDTQVLYLTALYDLKAHANGLDNPLDPVLDLLVAQSKAAGGWPTTEGAMVFAMKTNHPGAAMAAATVLGKTATAEELLYDAATPRSLIDAVRYRDRRVRFAAISTIMQLEPNRPYAGSSEVTEALRYFARSKGRRLAVVASPDAEEASFLAGFLISQGYRPELAFQGRGVMAWGTRSPDVELVLADSRLLSPRIDFLLKEMRNDNRTAEIPVAVYAHDGQQARADLAASGISGAMSFPRPHNQTAAEWIVANLLEKTDAKPVPVQQRLDQARHSLVWLKEMKDLPKIYHLDDLEPLAASALMVPELQEEAIGLLSKLDSLTAQLQLVELAGDRGEPIATRRQAMEAFFENADRYGILLRGRQILDQYARYNRSESESQESQEILGAILDYFEEKTATKTASK
jgi:hypothetical protein